VLSDTLRYINLTGLVIELVTLRGPMNLCVCVGEERGDGEGADSQELSDTLRYIHLSGLTIGLVVLCVWTDASHRFSHWYWFSRSSY
jgi:hypothetical protein